jgi:hypothetical protein
MSMPEIAGDRQAHYTAAHAADSSNAAGTWVHANGAEPVAEVYGLAVGATAWTPGRALHHLQVHPRCAPVLAFFAIWIRSHLRAAAVHAVWCDLMTIDRTSETQ